MLGQKSSEELSQSGSLLSTMGIFITCLSLVMALLVLFVIPGNNYGSSFILLILSSFFIVGLVFLLVGKALKHRTVR